MLWNVLPSTYLKVFLSFLCFTMNFSQTSKSVRQPAGCCLWCLWADRECSGRPEQRNKPCAPPAIKAHHPTLDHGGGKKVLRKQLQPSHGVFFFFLFCVHICSMPNKSLESLELAHADKTAIKGVINTREERGEKQNNNASHWHVKLLGITAVSKMCLTSVVNQQNVSLASQWRRKDHQLLLLLWNTSSFDDKSDHHFFLIRMGFKELCT